MSKLKLAKIKDNLIKERNLILKKLGGNDLSVDPNETPDPVDLAVRNYSKNVMLAVSEHESKNLTMIADAIERIEDDEYGLCKNCEDEINPKRLNAVPWAPYCINCQELQEKGLLDEN